MRSTCASAQVRRCTSAQVRRCARACVVCAACALVATLALSSAAYAQSAAIRGRIVDEQGRVLVGATVTVSNPQTGFKRTEVSDAEGLYRFAGLPSGIYDVSASRDAQSRPAESACE